MSIYSSSSSSPCSRVRVLTMSRTTPDWTSLPIDLVQFIAKHLPSRFDISRFRAVCHYFQSSVPPPPKSKYTGLDLRISFPVSPCYPDLHFALLESTVYSIQPLDNQTTQIWLVKIQESKSGQVIPEHPLSRFLFPSLSDKLPDALNLLDYRVEEITKTYRLKLVAPFRGKQRLGNYEKHTFFSKVVVSTCFNPTDDEFSVMALYNYRLGMWRNLTKKWIHINVGSGFLYNDIVFHNNKFYALAESGVVVTVDSKTLTTTQITSPRSFDYGVWYLVKSFEDLLLVIKSFNWLDPDNSEGVHFNVYRLDEDKREWIEVVNGLEDRVLFLGDDCSYSLSAKEVSGFKGNCIHFLDFYYAYCFIKYNHPRMNVRVLDLNKGVDSPDISKIYWPPPWLE